MKRKIMLSVLTAVLLFGATAPASASTTTVKNATLNPLPGKSLHGTVKATHEEGAKVWKVTASVNHAYRGYVLIEIRTIYPDGQDIRLYPCYVTVKGPGREGTGACKGSIYFYKGVKFISASARRYNPGSSKSPVVATGKFR